MPATEVRIQPVSRALRMGLFLIARVDRRGVHSAIDRLLTVGQIPDTDYGVFETAADSPTLLLMTSDRGVAENLGGLFQ